MNKIETFATVEKGKLNLIQRDKFNNALTSLSDGRYSLRLEKLFGKRSNKQNAYYWGIVIPIVLLGLQDLGHEATEVEEAHNIVKKLFLKPKNKRKRLINKNTGQYMYVVNEPTTKKLTTIEFNEYFEKIIQWGAEFLDVQIPYPNEMME